MKKKLSYGFGNFPIVSDKEHNISIHVFTDLPIWNFRVYNNISIWDADKMIRVMFTEASIIDLREPGKNRWDIDSIDLINLDNLIKNNWGIMIDAYNNEIGTSQLLIPKTLKKPDYTKLSNCAFRKSLYITYYEEES